MADWGPFTLAEASGLSEVLRAVERNLPVAWDAGSGTWHGQATHLTERDGTSPGQLTDVRDLYMNVKPHSSGIPSIWHVCALIRAYPDGCFIVNPT